MLPNATWRPPPAAPRTPTAGEAHIWLIDLAGPLPCGPAALDLLSADEAARAGAFHAEADRNRFAAARTGLRRILALYLGARPADLRFETGPWGKPCLAGGDTGLVFNLSHCGELALAAVARSGDVGIDVERIRPERSILELARRFFHDDEAAQVAACADDEERAVLFHLYWTCKEAYVKAIGEGLRHGLKSFRAILDDPEHGPHVLPGDSESGRWPGTLFTPAAGHAGALVTRGERPTISYWKPQFTAPCAAHNGPRRP